MANPKKALRTESINIRTTKSIKNLLDTCAAKYKQNLTNLMIRKTLNKPLQIELDLSNNEDIDLARHYLNDKFSDYQFTLFGYYPLVNKDSGLILDFITSDKKSIFNLEKKYEDNSMIRENSFYFTRNCQECGYPEAIHHEDPIAREFYGDDTKGWYCKNCLKERAEGT